MSCGERLMTFCDTYVRRRNEVVINQFNVKIWSIFLLLTRRSYAEKCRVM